MRIFHMQLVLLLFFCQQLRLEVVMSIPEIRWVEILNNKRNKNDASTSRRRKRKRRSIVPNLKSDDKVDDVQELYLRQSLDHFRLQDDRTFAQRYFYTNRFVAAGGGVSHNYSNGKNNVRQELKRQQKKKQKQEFAFLCVGGEGPGLDKSVMLDSVHCTGDMIELAKILHTKYNASVHLYALEHRFYGKSYPSCFKKKNATSSSSTSSSSPVSNENLVYLSSRQALADLSNFVTTMNAAHCSCCKETSMQWVTFGGSYPGMLAAWARLQFPHLIHAAVSNSAPIQAKLDFPEYNGHAGWALQYDKVGGSPACLDIVRDGHAELAVKVLDPTMHAEIAQDFNLCNATSLTNPKNVQLFLGDGVYSSGAQDNDPSCKASPRCNIAQKCQAIINAKTSRNLTSYETLRWMVQQDQVNQNCTVLDWQGTLDYIANPQFNGSDDEDNGGGLRSWIWQTCTEFGFYQTCELHSDCPYGRGWHNVSQDLEICQYAFGVHASRVVQAVQETLAYYGGWKLKATQVLSVNGNVDPWSELALVPTDPGHKTRISTTISSTARRHTDEETVPDDDKDNDDTDRPTWMVPGASHHFWTHAVKETDSPEVVQARQVIYKTVLGWLFSESNNNNNDDDSIDERDMLLGGGRNRNAATSQACRS
jgi:thymus-specific serine protease